MDGPEFASILGPALAGALEQRGFERLTTVQEAVLDPALAGRDLRITSQTGSGKTVAIGLALRELVQAASENAGGKASGAKPCAIVVAPTRELAKQVEEELRWLYAGLRAKVVAVTGGASYLDERRGLASGPALVVGTPGRLLDHLNRRNIDPSEVGAIVLDEADRMLDLGFREDLEAILAFAPEGHRTHLISATFPHYVRALADKVQNDPAHVEGTPLGAANADIDHVVYLVDPYERIDAIVNLLLHHPDEQTLVFARTRADVARIARDLGDFGFAVSSISGEMEQPARNRALADFKNGNLRVLVATDVAARGIDVQDITRVIHAEPPDDPDSYTHRSGRTGRAGRKGQSAVLTSPSGLSKTSLLLKRARVKFRIESIPTPDDIRAAREERIATELLAEDPEGFTGHSERLWAFAKRLAGEGATPEVTRTIARLLLRGNFAGPTEARTLRVFAKPEPERATKKPYRSEHPAHRHEHAPPPYRGKRAPLKDGPRSEPGQRDGSRYGAEPTHDGAGHHGEAHDGASHRGEARNGFHPRSSAGGPRADARRGEARTFPHPQVRPPRTGAFVPFRVTWGGEHGADARRLLAMVCRRGEVRGADVGNIRIARAFSTVEIAANVADAFAETVAKPDPRNPRVFIRRDSHAAMK
jgi:ATP-dependent RNA helicase DeaD